MRWSIYTSEKRGAVRHVIPLGRINAPDYTRAWRKADERWPQHTPPSGAGFSIRLWRDDRLSLGRLSAAHDD